ncbi:protein kinase domain-containing protein [Endothiovibrio diazotrophicus]
MTPPLPDPQPPRTIDRFEVQKVLGRGAQGVVYLARDPRLDRRVAIKTLAIDPTADPRAQRLLMQEAKIVGQLQHANIVPIFEAGEDHGKLFLVFEYVDGTTLAALLKRGGALPVHQAVNLIMPVLDGIAYAHEEGVIHGDLKPANILIGRNRVPRVMDFGVARMLGKSQEGTLAGEKREGLWGSLNYMSPEHFGNREPDARSDLFALGLILWEMLTGRMAVDGDSQLAIMHKIANEPIPRPSLGNSKIDPELDGIVMRALEKEPNQRYRDTFEMKEALEHYLHKDEEPQELDGKQSTLAFLMRRMRHKPDFPAISQHISEINRAAASDADSSANELSNIILKEYSLTNKLIKLVNSSFYGQYGGKISTVSRAVVILGFDQVRAATLSLMLFEHLRNKEQVAELKDTLLGSLISGSFSRTMAKRMKLREPEQAFVCSLLHNLGKMLVIFYFPEEFEQIQTLVEQKRQDEVTASNSVLGLTYHELGRGIAKEWNFPQSIVDSMNVLPPGPVQRPAGEDEKLQQLTNFSNELVRLAATGDPAEKSRATAALAERYEKGMGLKGEQITALLDAAVENLQQFTDILNIDAAKSPFVKRVSNWNKPAAAAAEAVVEETPEAAARRVAEEERASAEDLQMALLNGIQEITNALLGNYSVNEIMMMILETMYRGLGLSRVLVCIADGKRANLNARFGFGKEIDTVISEFKVPIKPAADLFGQAVAEERDLVVDNVGETEGLPEWHRQRISATSLAVYPIIINKIPVGLFYGDLEGGAKFTPTHLNYMKTLRNQAVLAIRQKAG